MSIKMEHQSKRGAFSTVLIILLILALLVGSVAGTYVWQNNKVNDLSKDKENLTAQVAKLRNEVNQLKATKTDIVYTSQKGVKINIYTPANDSQISSPLTVLGEVPGNWSFEASFPVQLKDSNGNVVIQQPATLHGDWMTESLVPFSVNLTFEKPATSTGTLVLQKDNPSGLPENDDSVSIAIKF